MLPVQADHESPPRVKRDVGLEAVSGLYGKSNFLRFMVVSYANWSGSLKKKVVFPGGSGWQIYGALVPYQNESAA
jgi:hypothetical protein